MKPNDLAGVALTALLLFVPRHARADDKAPWLLGKAISHGCVRVANSTAAALKRLAPVGTPIFIKA